MSSTEPQNQTGSQCLPNKSKKFTFKSIHLKALACGVIAVAVCATGTFCFTNGLNSPKMMNRSLASGLGNNAINPQYIESVTRVYSETVPTDPPTEASTEKPTEKPTKKAKEKATEKATEKTTEKPKEKATEKKTDAETDAPTDPETIIETVVIPDNTQNVQIGSSVDNGQHTEVFEPETTPPLTEEEIIERDESYKQQWNNGYLLAIDAPDYNYNPQPVKLSDKDRDLAYRIVMGEMGGEGFVGASIVAQAIRDTMNLEGYTTIQEVIDNYGYVGSTKITPNQDSIDAVNFIFDQNGSAVQHRVLFFYATWITSDWHESQNFVCQYDCVRFFDRWF